MRRLVFASACAAVSALTVHAAAQGASARLAYDAANLALNGGEGYQTADNKTGTLAWGEAYIMMSYAAMYRATNDAAYLVNLASHARSVLDYRDSVLGWKDYAGNSRPCWQSTKYSDNQEPVCWVVHSGMITYPMADLARIVAKDPALQALPVPWGGTLGEAAQTILAAVLDTVATHEAEWKTGPGSGEGYYRGDPSAPVASVAGKALPLNQMNAMGMTLAAIADGAGDAQAEQKAKGMCAYLRHRMTEDGARMVWTYWGDAWTGSNGEDISHAALNVEFASLCHARGWFFTLADMVRIARTLFEKVHVDSDTAWDRIDGTGAGNTYRTAVGRWLTVSPFDPRVWAVGANAYRTPDTTPNGGDLHALSLIALHAPAVRGHTFYTVDWQDLGDSRKATANDANILILPPQPAQRYALKLRYKASRVSSVQQWDGTAYHANIRLAPASTLDTGWIPYDPAIYMAYSGASALYQLHDAFVAGQGIEVQEAAPVVEPSISPPTLAETQVGASVQVVLQGAGDPPLLWSLVQGPASASLDLQSGALSWTVAQADAPLASFTVRLTNDSGSATATFTVPVLNPTILDGGSDSALPEDASGDDAIQPAQDGASPAEGGQPSGDGSADAAGKGSFAAGDGDDGCSCHTAGRRRSATLGWLALAGLAVASRRRRW